jgi:hypothetical protein
MFISPVPRNVTMSAPAYSCPSAPMFQNLALKATAAASPVKIRGVALEKVSARAKDEPIEPVSIIQYASKTEAPLQIIRPEQSNKLVMIAIIGAKMKRIGETSDLGSRRISLPSRHEQT